MSRAGSRLCRGELSRGTNLCFSSAVSEAWRDPRGVTGSGGDRSNTTAPGTARGARVVPPPPRTSSTLCMHLLFPGPPARFLLSFVFLLRRELFDAACSLFSSVRVRTRLTHN